MSETSANDFIAIRSFTMADQHRFAALSGDVNPMHVDAVAARRLLAGRAVVHGMHTLLVALEAWPGGRGDLPVRITADFASPVCVGDEVQISCTSEPDDGTVLRASVQGLASAHIDIRTAIPVPIARANLRDGAATPLAPLDTPLRRPPASWVGQRQRLALPCADFAEDFPRCCAWLGERRIAAVGLLSYYVGMVCPGLDSVFASVVLEPGAEDATDLVFEVRRFDPRFALFVIAFDGGLRGEIKAFLRARPQAQPPMMDVLPKLQPDEFAGRRIWVIGGSRGLGELTAKLAAAGGAEVTVTYASGAEDAQRVTQEINSSGRGSARMRRLDLTADELHAWVAAAPPPDAVFYFATPRIFRKRPPGMDSAVLAEFITFYVEKLHALCCALQVGAVQRRVRVFNPSTVFLEDRPKGMTEYAMAKAAAEVMLQDFNRQNTRVQVMSRRLPKLATDQTSTALGSDAAEGLDVMLPVVREMLLTAQTDD